MKTIDTIIQSKNCIDNKNKQDNFIENTKIHTQLVMVV